MKRIFAIMAAVALCFVLTVPAFAVDYNGHNLPDIAPVLDDSYNKGYSHAFIDEIDDYVYLLWLVNDFGTDSSTGEIVVNGDYCIYYYSADSFDYLWEIHDRVNNSSAVVKFSPRKILWSDIPIPVINPETTSPAPVLGTMAGAYETSDFVLGAMGQVLSLVALVIPVVAGLFGIRKGIAFLISRIRGV